MLVKAGVEIDKATTSTGATPLHVADENAHEEVVDALIAAGADKSKATAVDGATPMYIAAQRGHWQVVELLVMAGDRQSHSERRSNTLAHCS